MPTPTYFAIAKTVLTGTSSLITFSSIPSTYTDLILVASMRYNDGGGDRSAFTLLLNSQTTSSTDSSMTRLYGYSSAAASGRSSSTYFSNQYDVVGSGATANTFSSVEIYIPNYAGSANKVLSVSGVSENNSSTDALTGAVADLWQNTSAITTIKLQPSSGITNFASGSSFYLYGIKNS
jgi:hypothetical protein